MGDARHARLCFDVEAYQHIETEYSHEQNHHKIMPEGEKTTP